MSGVYKKKLKKRSPKYSRPLSLARWSSHSPFKPPAVPLAIPEGHGQPVIGAREISARKQRSGQPRRPRGSQVKSGQAWVSGQIWLGQPVRGGREKVPICLKGEREREGDSASLFLILFFFFFFFFFFLNPTWLSHVLVHVSLKRFVWKIFRGL
jgi:hypothetical protein